MGSGLVGMLAIGLFATLGVNEAGANGLFHGGGFGLLGRQAIACTATLAYAFIVTYVIATIIDRTLGFRGEPGGRDHRDRPVRACRIGL